MSADIGAARADLESEAERKKRRGLCPLPRACYIMGSMSSSDLPSFNRPIGLFPLPNVVLCRWRPQMFRESGRLAENPLFNKRQARRTVGPVAEVGYRNGRAGRRLIEGVFFAKGVLS